MPDLSRDAISTRMKLSAAQNLAARLLARPWTLAMMADAVGEMLPALHPRTRAGLAVGIFGLGEDRYPPAPQEIVSFLLESPLFIPKADPVVAAVLDPPVFAPLPGFAGLGIPAVATPADLADWLGLSMEELDWFSDTRNGQARAGSGKLLHYKHIRVRKPNGSLRLLEAPKARLKGIQRRILRKILALAPVHDRAHGFVEGRSHLTGAQVHAGEAVVVSFDLSAFFPSISAARVHGIFRCLGYPWAVARYLTGLCTTRTPPGVMGDDAVLRAVYGVRHLPQGAPTSPALANLLAWRLDLRLSGLAEAAGANYTRYADDLAFSGGAGFARSIERFGRTVAVIASEEGFQLNQSKTRVMRRDERQVVTGLVVNNHINVRRAAFDRLKAVLWNCARQGPASQNLAGVEDFRRYLEGRVGWVEQVNPVRGAKLRRVFEQIAWDADSA